MMAVVAVTWIGPVLHEKKMNVGDIRDLKPGSIIPLPHIRKMPIELRVDTEKGVAREPGIGNES